MMRTPATDKVSPEASPEVSSPSFSEPVLAGVIDRLGGPRGRFADPASGPGWWTPLRIIIAVAYVFLAFGYLSKANCAGGVANGDTVRLNWDGNRQYTSFCYNDIVPLYSGRGLDEGGFPYAFSWVDGDITRYMEYPVLAGMFQGVMAFIARATYGLVSWAEVPAAGWYFALTALVMSLMWVGAVVMAARLCGRRQLDALLIAASPVIIVHAFTNWDIPSIALAVGAMYAVSKQRPGLAGVLIGAGTAFKLWPVFLLGAYLVLAVRNRRFIPFGVMCATAAATWLVVNVPVALAYPEAWREFFRLNAERTWEWTTIYAVISRNTGLGLPLEALNVVSLVGFVVGCVGIGTLGLMVKRQPRVAELVFLILAAFLLCNKVWSPQYSLWLVIPAVLALPRWRLLIAWMISEMLVWPVLMWHMLGVDNKGLPHEFLDAVVLVRDGLIIAMAVLVIRQMLGRIPDKVLAAHRGVDVLEGSFGRR